MNYIKSLFYNFLAVFFCNHVLPGIDVVNVTRLPHLGGDIPFAAGLGLLNSLIYPLLKLTGRTRCTAQIGLAALVLNFLSYALLKMLPIGIHITLEGYFLGALIVSIIGFITNFFEMKANLPKNIPSVQEPPKL